MSSYTPEGFRQDFMANDIFRSMHGGSSGASTLSEVLCSAPHEAVYFTEASFGNAFVYNIAISEAEIRKSLEYPTDPIDTELTRSLTKSELDKILSGLPSNASPEQIFEVMVKHHFRFTIVTEDILTEASNALEVLRQSWNIRLTFLKDVLVTKKPLVEAERNLKILVNELSTYFSAADYLAVMTSLKSKLLFSDGTDDGEITPDSIVKRLKIFRECKKTEDIITALPGLIKDLKYKYLDPLLSTLILQCVRYTTVDKQTFLCGKTSEEIQKWLPGFKGTLTSDQTAALQQLVSRSNQYAGAETFYNAIKKLDKPVSSKWIRTKKWPADTTIHLTDSQLHELGNSLLDKAKEAQADALNFFNAAGKPAVFVPILPYLGYGGHDSNGLNDMGDVYEKLLVTGATALKNKGRRLSDHSWQELVDKIASYKMTDAELRRSIVLLNILSKQPFDSKTDDPVINNIDEIEKLTKKTNNLDLKLKKMNAKIPDIFKTFYNAIRSVLSS